MQPNTPNVSNTKVATTFNVAIETLPFVLLAVANCALSCAIS